MSEPIQTSSGLKGLMDGPKKAPPPPGPRETNCAGGPASARSAAANSVTTMATSAALIVLELEYCALGITNDCMPDFPGTPDRRASQFLGEWAGWTPLVPTPASQRPLFVPSRTASPFQFRSEHQR